MEKIPSFNAIIEKCIIDNWDYDALTDFKGATLQFHDVARKIEKLHISLGHESKEDTRCDLVGISTAENDVHA